MESPDKGDFPFVERLLRPKICSPSTIFETTSLHFNCAATGQTVHAYGEKFTTWNKSTQDGYQTPYDLFLVTMWLYVYERCSSLAKARTTFTGGVRAVWHGVVPGGDVALPGRK